MRQAVILAAGYGMRMVPINSETPKGLLTVRGEVLIERLIRQLRAAGVNKIRVVVGFMKEAFEYLIDDFNVELLVNPEYHQRNNLHSLALAEAYLSDAYILPCDIWCAENPFSREETQSWYMVSTRRNPRSTVRVDQSGRLARTGARDVGSEMIGIAYLTQNDGIWFRERLRSMDADPQFSSAFWEEALFEKTYMRIPARVVPEYFAVELNTYEQLRELDADSSHLHSETMELIAAAMGGKTQDITGIQVLKKGMTNRSFLFSYKGSRYIMRIPGEGTDRLIDRRNEACVYQTIRALHICDDIIYINPDNGYKITKYVEHARVCDPENEADLKRAMQKLREFHGLALQVDHAFDIFEQIDFYESLWNGETSAYPDYEKTKRRVLSLRPYVERHRGQTVLTHIDAVPDNFLFTDEQTYLIDWEYAGMQDPHVDIAMFCIYALYDRARIDRLIDLYFEGSCQPDIRVKIYCYIASCGLLWSNWCEYKRQLGVEFGEYSLRQYRYAKDFYRIAAEEMKKLGEA